MNPHSSASLRDLCRHSPHAAQLVGALAQVLLPISLLGACADQGIFEPAAPATASAATSARTGVVVTPDYSAFDARADFNSAGTIAQLNDFEAFEFEMTYDLPEPWTGFGVTYTSAQNWLVAKGLGLGIPSKSIASEFGYPVTGTFADGDALTLFGADLTLILEKVPVDIVLTTNVRSYAFNALDIPLATSGKRFFGVALARPGEYFKGFAVSFNGPSTAVLLDNVAVGHVATAVNAAPVASTGGPYTGNEGSAVGLALTGSDADGDALTYTWNLGDGTTGSGSTPPANHVYVDEGSYQITLTASDGRGGTHTATATATIANVAPTLAPFATPSTPVAVVPGGVTVAISAAITDPGTTDVHSAVLDCGNGVTVQSAAPNGTATGTCTFSAAGLYSVRFTVDDGDGGSDTRAAAGKVVVYDPTGGWITGGGWIASTEGASWIASVARVLPGTRRSATNAASLTGKLTFAFVARYEGGGTPAGNAAFKLQLTTFDFTSTTLDWLVVSAGTAYLHGRGTVNGSGDYEFDVSIVDNPEGDSIRVRIWNRDTGEVVLDSQPGANADSAGGTPVGGGSLEIHMP